MGNGWITVDSDGVAGGGLDYWIGVALEYNERAHPQR